MERSVKDAGAQCVEGRKTGPKAGWFGRLRRFRDAEDGSLSVEFTLWLPILFTAFGLMVDTSLTFVQLNQSWDVARDVTRRVAVGELTNAEAEIAAKAVLPAAYQPVVSVTDEGVRDIRFTMTMSPQLGSVGGFSTLFLGDLNVTYVMRRETDTNTGGGAGA